MEQDLQVPATKAFRNLVQTKGSHEGTLIASSVQSPEAFDKSDMLQEATKATNFYWCTICEERRSYKNISDWRKHEKEHVVAYVCMLTAPVDETEGYVKCSLCGLSNPSEKHLSAHNIHSCGRGIPGSFSCKRRDGFVQHLMKCHKVETKAQGAAIAEKWKETTKKQVWSCGFCVYLLHNFGDRLKHIATHFERGQTLDEWDTTNVIEGLLSQPRMVNVWSKPWDWRSSEITWKKDAVQKLQDDLELVPADPVHAKALGEAVYSARQSDRHLLNHDRPFAFAPNYQALEQSALEPTSEQDSTPSRLFQPSSNHEQPQIVDPAETLHNGFSALGGDPMATNDYDTRQFSFPGESSRSMDDTWQLDAGQAWPSASDPYNGYSVNQEQSNAATGVPMWYDVNNVYRRRNL